MNKKQDSTSTIPGRQGDIMISAPCDLPAGVKLVKRDKGRIVLAYGEVTGHAHAIHDRRAKLWEAADGRRYLQVAQPCDLQHEEHSTIHIMPGTYEVIRQCEYAPGELPQQVAD